jgi:hypothetical protein
MSQTLPLRLCDWDNRAIKTWLATALGSLLPKPWSTDHVQAFVKTLADCGSLASKLEEHKITGNFLDELCENDELLKRIGFNTIGKRCAFKDVVAAMLKDGGN